MNHFLLKVNKGIFSFKLTKNKNFLSLLQLSKFDFVQKVVLEEKLKNKIKCEELQVEDISGNCGTSFSIKITSPDFKGKTVIMQHRMVNEALKEELKEIHALQIKSSISK